MRVTLDNLKIDMVLAADIVDSGGRLLLPNGTVYYHFSDGDSFRWRRAAVESDRIRSYCARRKAEGAVS